MRLVHCALRWFSALFIQEEPMLNYLTPEEVAGLVRKHPETVRDALRAGELKGFQRKKRGPWLVREDWLDEWLQPVA